MPGRKPILATLVQDMILFIRDSTFKMILEPKQKKPKKDNKEDQ